MMSGKSPHISKINFTVILLINFTAKVSSNHAANLQENGLTCLATLLK